MDINSNGQDLVLKCYEYITDLFVPKEQKIRINYVKPGLFEIRYTEDVFKVANYINIEYMIPKHIIDTTMMTLLEIEIDDQMIDGLNENDSKGLQAIIFNCQESRNLVQSTIIDKVTNFDTTIIRKEIMNFVIEKHGQEFYDENFGSDFLNRWKEGV